MSDTNNNELTPKEILDLKVKAAYEALSEACEYADETKQEFRWTPFYGGGGWYNGDPALRDEYSQEDGWSASSQGC